MSKDSQFNQIALSYFDAMLSRVSKKAEKRASGELEKDEEAARISKAKLYSESPPIERIPHHIETQSNIGSLDPEKPLVSLDTSYKIDFASVDNDDGELFKVTKITYN